MADQAEYWRRAFAAHAQGAREILEIGSFVGGSAVLFLSLLPQARITCVDPFTGDLHGGEAYNGDVETIEQRFDAATAPFRDRVRKIRSRSVPALDALRQEGRSFEIVYIDGSHVHDDILVNSLLAWPLLKVGGLMMWDDYRGGATWDRDEDPGTPSRPFSPGIATTAWFTRAISCSRSRRRRGAASRRDGRRRGAP